MLHADSLTHGGRAAGCHNRCGSVVLTLRIIILCQAQGCGLGPYQTGLCFHTSMVLQQVQWCGAYACAHGLTLTAMLVLVCLLRPQQLRLYFPRGMEEFKRNTWQIISGCIRNSDLGIYVCHHDVYILVSWQSCRHFLAYHRHLKLCTLWQNLLNTT